MLRFYAVGYYERWRRSFRPATSCLSTVLQRRDIFWEIIADNLRKAGWSWGYVSAVGSEGRTIWIVDANRGNGKGFVVHTDGNVDCISGTGIDSSRLLPTVLDEQLKDESTDFKNAEQNWSLLSQEVTNRGG